MFDNVFYATSRVVNTGDILDLISSARSFGTTKILLRSELITKDFFSLRTGVAGEFLQKFINYNNKVAILLDSKSEINPRLREMVSESNKQGNICYFDDLDKGVNWLRGE